MIRAQSKMRLHFRQRVRSLRFWIVTFLCKIVSALLQILSERPQLLSGIIITKIVELSELFHITLDSGYSRSYRRSNHKNAAGTMQGIETVCKLVILFFSICEYLCKCRCLMVESFRHLSSVVLIQIICSSAQSIAILQLQPPSRKCSPSTSTGLERNGIDAEARIACRISSHSSRSK